MELVLIHGLMVELIQVTGQKGICTEKGFHSGLMVDIITGSIIIIKNKVLEFLNVPMAEYMKANGIKTSNMV